MRHLDGVRPSLAPSLAELSNEVAAANAQLDEALHRRAETRDAWSVANDAVMAAVERRKRATDALLEAVKP